MHFVTFPLRLQGWLLELAYWLLAFEYSEGTMYIKSVVIILAAFQLSGCAGFAEAMARAQAERQRQEAERRAAEQRCISSGNVVYGGRCLTPRQAEIVQQQDFIAEQNRLHREAMREQACIARGGSMSYGQCFGERSQSTTCMNLGGGMIRCN